MKPVSLKDSIAELHLSVRAFNCLMRGGVRTVEALLAIAQSPDLQKIRNLGVKCCEEVKTVAIQLLSGEGEFCLRERMAPVSQENPTIDHDITLQELGIAPRILNALLPDHITRASQLVMIPDQKLTSKYGLSDAACKDVLSMLTHVIDRALIAYRLSEAHVAEDQRLCLAVTNELVQVLDGESRQCLREVIHIRADYPEAIGESLYYRLYDAPYIATLLKTKILDLLESNEDGITRNNLAAHLPAHLSNTTIIEECLLSLENDDLVECSEVIIKRKYPSVLNCIETLFDEKRIAVLRGRFSGKTLDEVGQELSLTRERVRQLQNKCLAEFNKKQLRFREDRYLSLYKEYDFSLDEFCITFDEAPSTYYYLDSVCNVPQAQKKTLQEFISNPAIPTHLRKQCERVLYRDYVMLNGVRVKRDRPSLCHYFVRSYCTEITEFDDFLIRYHEWLAELGLQDNSNLVIEAKTYENKLNGANYVLWNQWRRFRYYNIASRDYELLLNTLYIEQYKDMEISTLKLFRENPELMEEYDIRDEYELHNLLKKIWPADKPSVVFRKMPSIEIGTGNRNNQVLELLLQYAPISIDDLAVKYEEVYGAKANTVRGTYLRDFDEYFFNGMYTIDTNNLPYEQFSRMKAILVKDYYTIAKVKQLYLQEFPEGDVNQINPYTLKTLGFHVYSGYAGYVIKNSFPSAIDYFNHLLVHDDIVDAREFEKSILYCGIYSEVLGKLKARREIVEFSPFKYINMRRLNQFDITHDTLQEYCSAVFAYVEPGEIFSITSLREAGFSHHLDDLGFDEWFYSSILLTDKERFSYLKIGGTRLLMRGKGTHLLNLLLTRIVGQQGKIDFYDLCDILEERYGIRLPREKVMEYINNTDLYYDRIMEAVYIDYETYFEEV